MLSRLVTGGHQIVGNLEGHIGGRARRWFAEESTRSNLPNSFGQLPWTSKTIGLCCVLQAAHPAGVARATDDPECLGKQAPRRERRPLGVAIALAYLPHAPAFKAQITQPFAKDMLFSKLSGLTAEQALTWPQCRLAFPRLLA